MKMISFLISVFLITSAFADDQVQKIKPFTLEWTDSLSEAAEKLCKTDGLDKCGFEVGSESNVSLKKFDIKKTEEAIRRSVKDLFKGQNEIQKKQVIETKFSSLPMKDSKEAYWLQGYISIKAKPVIIQGVSFIVNAKFMLHPGLNVKAPEKVLWIDGYKKIALPAFLEEVTLTSTIASVEQCNAIYETLKNKYKFTFGNSLASDSAMDSEGNKVRIQGTTGQCSISYNGSFIPEKELQDAFVKFNSEINSKGKKDLGGDL